MPDIGYAVTSVAMNTGTGSQAITIACGGRTPKAVAIFASRATALGTPADGAMLSKGFSDGTNTRCSAVMAEDAAAIAGYQSGRSNPAIDGVIVRTLATADQTTDGEASFTSFGADTVTINVTDAPTAAVLLVVWAFFGADLQAAVGSLVTASSLDGDATVSGLAFRPRVVLGFAALGGFNTANAAALHSFGAAVLNDAGTVQGQFGECFFDRPTPTINTVPGGGIRDDSYLQRITVTVLGVITEEGRYEVTSGTADGFVVTTRGGATGITTAFLALYTSTARAFAFIPTLNTNVAGAKNVTGVGFRATAMCALGGMFTAKNAYVQDATAEHTSIGVATEVAQRSVSWQNQSNETVSDTRSGADLELISVLDDVGGHEWSGSLALFTSDGATITIDDPSPVSDRMVGMLFLEGASLIASDSEEISEQAALAVGLASAETEQIADEVLLMLDVSSTIQASDSEELSETLVMAATLVLSESVEIADEVAFPGTLLLVLSESEALSESAQVYLGNVLVVSESVQVADEIALPLTTTQSKAAHRGATLQGGAEAGWTFQGGAERGGSLG